MSRTAAWIHNTPAGVPPPPPSLRPFSPAPSTVYPSSSVSNPDASRYRRLRSQSLSSSAHSPSSRHTPSRGYSQDAPRSSSNTYRTPSVSSRASGGSGSRMYVPSSGTYVRPDGELPVVAKTMSQDGKTRSWVIIPPEGQRVEVVSPQRPATSMGHHYYPAGSHHSYAVPSSPTSTKGSKNFVKRMLDRVEWGGKSSHARSRSISIAPSHLSSSSRRSRRNSTGSGSGGFTIVSGARGRDSGVSVSTVRAGGHKVDVIRI